jgi:hypothetical protein
MLVIYCFVTNYSKTELVQITYSYYFTVSAGQESGRGITGPLAYVKSFHSLIGEGFISKFSHIVVGRIQFLIDEDEMKASFSCWWLARIHPSSLLHGSLHKAANNTVAGFTRVRKQKRQETECM